MNPANDKMLSLLASFLFILAISQAQVTPVLKSTPQVLGIVADPQLNRDSCGSALFNSRALWTCRDTQLVEPDGTLNETIWSSSASWTNFTDDGYPDIQQSSTSGEPNLLLMYGSNNESPFFPYQSDECSNSTSGQCPDGTRYALWPDSPPMVVSNDSSAVVAYTWIKQSHINGLTPLNPDPATTLYRLDYAPSSDVEALPVVSVVDEYFWAADELDFGTYGNVVVNGTAYLYSHASNGNIALAKVPADSVEDKTSYEYWVSGGWTTDQPAIDATGINITNVTAGSQGTFYWSDSWSSFVWIGQANNSVLANFYITTAPEPQGPWVAPTQFWQSTNGNSSLPAYSVQAHPDLVKEGNNEIYLTYTIDNLVNGSNVYTTPLILVEWQ